MSEIIVIERKVKEEVGIIFLICIKLFYLLVQLGHLFLNIKGRPNTKGILKMQKLYFFLKQIKHNYHEKINVKLN